MGAELTFAADLINRVVDGYGLVQGGPRVGMHICRGNWSTREEVLLTGDYAPLLPALTRMRLDQFVLEYATPRAGDIAVVGQALNTRELGLGVVNPRTTTAEPPEQIVAQAEAALRFYRPEQLWLNTDCGFGCFANRCVNVEEVAVAKIRNMALAARMLRDKHG